MAAIRDAILAIRTAVQDHGDDRTQIGRAARLDQVKWLGELLKFSWPQNYLDLITVHDGVTVREAHMPAFFEAFQTFIVHRAPWHAMKFWPIAKDGCGDYWVLALEEQREGDCPVYFLDHESKTGMGAPDRIASGSIADFVVDYMQSSWARGEEE